LVERPDSIFERGIIFNFLECILTNLAPIFRASSFSPLVEYFDRRGIAT
jgi:hypothetical protein